MSSPKVEEQNARSYSAILCKLTSVCEAKVVLKLCFVEILSRTMHHRKMALCSTWREILTWYLGKTIILDIKLTPKFILSGPVLMPQQFIQILPIVSMPFFMAWRNVKNSNQILHFSIYESRAFKRYMDCPNRLTSWRKLSLSWLMWFF